MSNVARTSEELAGVSLLGNQNTKYSDDYDPLVLETFVNKHPNNDYVVTFDAYEFTSKCLSGDTLVDVARDENLYPQGVPIRDLVGTEGYVFSVDPNTLSPVVKKYTDVRCTGTARPVVRVNMAHYNRLTDDWKMSSITCTPDHLFLVKQGFKGAKWVKAEDLTADMRLIYNQHVPGNDYMRGSTNRHRAIAAAIYGESAIEGNEIHHINGNHFDNRPENLANLTPSEHQHLHRSKQYGYDELLDVSELVELYNSGESIASLARMFDCDTSTIRSRLKDVVTLRPQRESLLLRNRTPEIIERNNEICKLYLEGYLIKELSDYFQLHGTRISEILKENNIAITESNQARIRRNSSNLPPLNHKIVSVEPAGNCDVYNMEVEDTHCFFANGVIVHNCPKTGQPDFAKVIISYIPNERMVESKSLKLYLFSFRNHGDFHEDCMNIIMKDLIRLMDPKYIEVRGIFSPRGGISIFPFVNYANPDFKFEKFAETRMLDALRDASNRTTRYDI